MYNVSCFENSGSGFPKGTQHKLRPGRDTPKTSFQLPRPPTWRVVISRVISRVTILMTILGDL